MTDTMSFDWMRALAWISIILSSLEVLLTLIFLL